MADIIGSSISHASPFPKPIGAGYERSPYPPQSSFTHLFLDLRVDSRNSYPPRLPLIVRPVDCSLMAYQRWRDPLLLRCGYF
jgi:hypothetical protein